MLGASVSLPVCLKGVAVQLNQRPCPHQSIIISLSPWIPPARLQPDELVCCVGGKRIEWGGVLGCCWDPQLKDQ